MPILLIPVETAAGETRVAASPETVKKFTAQGCRVILEKGAGQSSGYLDEAYAEAGAELVSGGDSTAWSSADVLLCVQTPSASALSDRARTWPPSRITMYLQPPIEPPK